MKRAPHASLSPPPQLVQLVMDAQAGDGELLAAYLRTHPEQRATAQSLAMLWNDIGTVSAPPLRIGCEPRRATLIERINARSRRPAVLAMAAAMLAVLTTTLAYPGLNPFATRAPDAPIHFAAQDQNRRVELADGSIVTLAARSAIAVALENDIRAISLDRGEAYFEVAHDKRRPFVVTSGNGHARAVGTAFSVAQTATGSTVTVTEGVVRISDDANATRRQLTQGQQVDYRMDRATGSLQLNPTRKVNGATETSWTSGFLTFDRVPLAQVLERVNRHSTKAISLTDERLGRMPVFATLKVGETDGILAIIREQGKLSAAQYHQAVHVQDRD